jgi:hypothetical protein
MNQVEIWFSILHRRILRHGDFGSTGHQKDEVEGFIRHWNQKEAASRLSSATAEFIVFFRGRSPVAQPNRIHRISANLTRPLLLLLEITQVRAMTVQVGAVLGFLVIRRAGSTPGASTIRPMSSAVDRPRVMPRAKRGGDLQRRLRFGCVYQPIVLCVRNGGSDRCGGSPPLGM